MTIFDRRVKTQIAAQSATELKGIGDFWDSYLNIDHPSQVLSPKDGVEGELWQSGTPRLHELSGRRYDMVVGMEMDQTQRVSQGMPAHGYGIHIWHPIHDSFVKDANAIRQIAGLVAERVDSGDKVLVHCTAGLNRSGIVSARAMMYLGWSATDAIAILRQRRDAYALCNPEFEKWLHSEEAAIDELEGEV